MFGRLFLLFLVVPMVDLALLVSIGGRIGFWPTIAIVVLTAALGSWLAKREGVAAWRRVQTKMTTGGIPGPELIDGLVILVSGTLLLTPGFLTDVVGFLGLLPPSRAVAHRWLRARFEKSILTGRMNVVHSGVVFGGDGGARPANPFGVPPPPIIEDAEIIDDGSGQQ
ncbi:FxsA family protein [Rubrivirga sp.]|uniref:FxsA family protein n=1 Tax=Rubrivirga sp. TaxID=1885344 RepID=UPI003C753794